MVTLKGNSQLDYVYTSKEPWAKDMLQRMQAIKGFPLQRSFIMDAWGEDLQGEAKDALNDALADADPKLKAAIEASRPKYAQTREDALKDPAKRAELEKGMAQAYQRQGLTEAEARADVDAWMKDPKHYEVIMLKNMGRAKKRAEGNLKLAQKVSQFSFTQTISKLSTTPLQKTEFEVGSTLKKVGR